LDALATRLGAAYATTRAPETKSYGPHASDALRAVGVHLFPWQEELMDQTLEIDEEDRLTRTTVVTIQPRRNGKSLWIIARALYGIIFLGEEQVIYSAHRLDTARAVFDDFRKVIAHPELAQLVTKVHLAHGKEAIEFTNGGRFTIRTRTGHGGRGMECSTLIFDEALILDSDSVSALAPLTARAAAGGRGQIIYASSAGNNGEESEILLGLRDRGRALAGTPGDGMVYVEHAAERHEDLDDPETWRRANPSLGTAILSEQFLADQRGRLSVEAFLREHCGIWTDGAGLPVIDPAEWESLTVTEPPDRLDGSLWLAFDLAPDRCSSRVLGFYRTDDGRIAVSVLDSLDDPRGIDSDTYAARVLSICEAYDPEVVGFDRLTGAHVEQILRNHGWTDRLRPMTGGKLANGCGTLLAAVKLRTVCHDGHADLAEDLGRATRKDFADGAWIFSRKSVSSGPIAGAIALGIGFFLAGDELLA
jgi:hypothetical protein